MIWVVIFILIIVSSAILAFRSMRNYQETPENSTRLSLFLIKNKDRFNLEALNKLYQQSLINHDFFSLERLFKGAQNALLLFGPRDLSLAFPELDLLELEDYLYDEAFESVGLSNDKKVSKNKSFPFAIEPPNNPKKTLSVKSGFLKLLDLSLEQYFFWQIVVEPIKKNNSPFFQATIRGIVADADLHQRVELAKKMTAHIGEYTGLLIDSKNPNVSTLFDSFKRRSFTPKEISNFVIDSKEIMDLLALPTV